jgi:GxxExxY protein
LIGAGKVILELKVVETLQLAHEAQLLNYLRATEMEIGLLLNFGPTPQLRRKVFLNDRKLSRKNPRQSV